MFHLKRFLIAIIIVIAVIAFILATCGFGALFIWLIARKKKKNDHVVALKPAVVAKPEPLPETSAKMDPDAKEKIKKFGKIDYTLSGGIHLATNQIFGEFIYGLERFSVLNNIHTVTGSEKLCIYADTHGNSTAIDNMEARLKKNPKETFVFVGDYLGRSNIDIMNLDRLLRISRENPDRVHLLRGNHETFIGQFICEGSVEELEISVRHWMKLDDETEHLGTNDMTKLIWSLYNLPIGVIVEKPVRTLCVHGCMVEDGFDLDKLNKLERTDSILSRITWAICPELVDMDREKTPAAKLAAFMKKYDIKKFVCGHIHKCNKVTVDDCEIVSWCNWDIPNIKYDMKNSEGKAGPHEPWIISK